MAQTSSIPGTALIAAALILSLLVTLSLPFLPGLDIARVTVDIEGYESDQRMGIWSSCMYYTTGIHTCGPREPGYEMEVYNVLNPSSSEVITSAWTRGLVLHPIATAFILIAFLASLFVSNVIALLATSFATCIASTAFILDIVLYAHLHSIVKDANFGAAASTSAGFWLSFASVVFLAIAGVVFHFARRREIRSLKEASYPLQSKDGKHWADKFKNSEF
ncbi:hypothetical protein BDN70DRAFT_933278 [Pholiota conissans]|uniref:Pali-domain-containing protein n=1 Tax=Pholiota conissans TaxID=109636 RepID=A0A9P6CTM6_9AGAR|nr:hypothetical protein BDN70DRAFT_933278 [Pholiota conissans]